MPISRQPTDPPTLFCLHYLGGSGGEWEGVRSLLAAQVRVVALDLPGFGAAAQLTGYGVADMVQTIATAIRLAAPTRWLLVGHSMGAKVAAGIARCAEDAAEGLAGLLGLVLVAGSPPAPEPMAREKREAMLGWFQGSEESSRAQARGYISDNVATPLPHDVNEGAIRDVLRSNRAAWTAWLESGSREDWSDRVGRLRAPALIVAGEQDGSLGADAQQTWMVPHFLESQLVTLPGAAHLLPLERPAELSRLILQHARAAGARYP